MTSQIILIIIGIVIIVLLLSPRLRAKLRMGAGKTCEAAVGICAAALDQTVRKNVSKQKILELMREKGEMTNEEIREHLGVSRRTAARYMDVLEREGKVIQSGDIGRGVVYRLR